MGNEDINVTKFTMFLYFDSNMRKLQIKTELKQKSFMLTIEKTFGKVFD